MKAIVVGIGVIVMGALAQSAAADIYTNSYGLGIDPFITFDEFAEGDKTGTEWQPEFGVTFYGTDFRTDTSDGFPGINGLNLLGYAEPYFRIEFDVPVVRYAMAWITNPGYTTFTTYLDGVFVEEATVASNYTDPEICFAVFENMTFDAIDASIDAAFTSFRIDNLQRIEVPAPAALMPLLLGVAAARRRRN
ncbi:MAG: hypothetical protein JSV91_03765 [Phycisphaerales bacterium]|nr:MAG: hypothetical protein JSV91_03765 [Phycisphaerales bacterium]